jgi:DNA mismatch repair protein PMS2
MLNKIDKESILQICSNQVVTDLKGAVKELVENSIDASASKIEIKFYQYGLDGIDVADTGKGINEEDFEIIAKRGTTSKITELDDIYRIKSLGFRGEALSSLCSLGEVTISTKQEKAEFGHSLKFDEKGDLIEKVQIARNVSETSYLYF